MGSVNDKRTGDLPHCISYTQTVHGNVYRLVGFYFTFPQKWDVPNFFCLYHKEIGFKSNSDIEEMDQAFMGCAQA